MSQAKRPRVFNIPASAPFLPTLIAALRNGELVPGFAPRDPLELARATLYLPTKRACRMAREAFLEALEVDAAVLPRIVPLGSIDEDEFAFAETAGDPLELPPAIGGYERRALLAKLILAWASHPDIRGSAGAPLVANSPSAAFALAAHLARLIDDVTTRQVSWQKLDELVPDALDPYWQYTLKFLKIAREHWPQVLQTRGAIEPAARRDKLIEAEANRLRAKPDGPVIAAGSTGSMPSTATLIATIATLPHGAVVLPGLDTDLDEASWQLVAGSDSVPPAAGHPQFTMQALLTRMELQRSDVKVLGASIFDRREVLTSEALRPAATTDQWPARLARNEVASRIAAGLNGLTLIEAANAEEEALAIAVALREAVETGKSAALVTPDRALARRVAAALARWNITAEDTGGEPLPATPAGVFARLAAEIALNGLAPVPLLALLKHPLLRLGRAAHGWDRGITAIERAVLRGPRPRADCAGLAQALAATRNEWDRLKRKEPSEIHPSDARALLFADDFDAAAELVGLLGPALAPLEQRAREKNLAFSTLALLHRDAVAALSSNSFREASRTALGDASRPAGTIAAFEGEDGHALDEAFEEIAAQSDEADMAIAPQDYLELFAAVAADRTVHRTRAADGRVRIYGVLEARLVEADRMILGGLVEGTWPPDVGSDPWLSRPMRHRLGLDLPELRIGLRAHDFAQLLGGPDVFLTRATKLGGAPTVASRFLQRLAAVAGPGWKGAQKQGETYLAWARMLDQPSGAAKPVTRPAPKPPRDTRPISLSVTEIETWLRDPYSIYAKHVLRLQPLEEVDTPPGARDRGTVIHGAIAEFTESYKDKLPDDPLGELLRLGEKYFAPLKDFPEARAFWWPRYLRIARWFVDFEQGRRAGLAKLDAEIRGAIDIAAGARTFKLRARADRIERLPDGRYAILDYKTGQVPTAPQVRSGLAPQMTLEGAILRQGGFGDLPPGEIAEFMYVQLRGGDPPGEPKPIAWKDTTPDEQAVAALRRLTKVVTEFEKETQGYPSKERPMFMRRRGGDYDHLARVREWSLFGMEEGDAE
jgi:ATP-dependent helicase/nuclease subunit B